MYCTFQKTSWWKQEDRPAVKDGTSETFCPRPLIFHGQATFKTATFLESGRDDGHLAPLLLPNIFVHNNFVPWAYFCKYQVWKRTISLKCPWEWLFFLKQNIKNPLTWRSFCWFFFFRKRVPHVKCTKSLRTSAPVRSKAVKVRNTKSRSYWEIHNSKENSQVLHVPLTHVVETYRWSQYPC